MAISTKGTAYDISGPKNAPVVVLIHGLGLTRQSTWGKISPVLAQRFKVLQYDLLGHGQSALPNEAVTLTALSEQLLSLMDELEIGSAALVGFSLGGMINRRFAMDHAKRVTALGILNSPHDRGDAQQAVVEKRAQDSASGGPSEGIEVTLARWFTPKFCGEHPQIVGFIREIVLVNEPHNYAAHRWVLAHGVRELIAPQPPISCPMLVMTCAHDSGSTPAMAQAISAETVGAQTVIVPQLQHLGLIEQPEAFLDPLRDFLQQNLT